MRSFFYSLLSNSFHFFCKKQLENFAFALHTFYFSFCMESSEKPVSILLDNQSSLCKTISNQRVLPELLGGAMPNIYKKYNAKFYVLNMIVIAIILFFAMFLSFSATRSNFFNKMVVESRRIAYSYAENIATANEASEIINGILDDKLRSVTEMITYLQSPIDDAFLAELAANLGLDEIIYYNQTGEVLHSASGLLVGWTLTPEYPAYEFMISDQTKFLDEIKPDSHTGIYYKFAYYRLSDGSFYQIGVSAERINAFLSEFQTHELLSKINTEESAVEGVYFIDNNWNVVAFGGIAGLNDILVSQKARTAMQEHGEYLHQFKFQNTSLFLTSFPIQIDNAQTGILAVVHNTADTDNLIGYLMVLLIIIYAAVFGLMVMIGVITYKKNKQLTFKAYHDIVTQLPNKRYFEEVVAESNWFRTSNHSAILLITCKNFHFFDAYFGYVYSENHLKLMTEKMKHFVSDKRMLFQISDEKFAFILKDYDSHAEVISFAKSIIKFLKTFLVHRAAGATIGIAEWKGNEKDNADEFLKRATNATRYLSDEELYQYEIYSDKLQEKLDKEAKIETELLNSTTGKVLSGLYLDFLPIVSMKNNQVVGFEALARLKTLEYGVVMPSEFIPVAERTQLIVPLFNQIVFKTCEFIRMLADNNFKNIKISLNISEIQVLRDDFVSRILNMIAINKINTANLQIEISETVFANNFDFINSKLTILKSKGVNIAIDDFGSGYSPLYQDGQVQVDTLKLDRGFISKLTKSNKKIIVGDIISMAHKMGNQVVAEGVENEEQRACLQENGCDYYQGYLYSKPLSPADAIRKLKKG